MLRIALLAVVLLCLAVALGWRLTGGRWLSVDSGSMGETAPVGTLVLTRPTTVAEVAVGDVVSFYPTAASKIAYTHRVVEIRDGKLITRGDINGADDPWRTGDENLVGLVVARWWGVAWLVKSLPFLLVGGFTVWLLTRWTGRWRTPLRLILYPLVVCVAIVVLRPLVGVILLGTFTEGDVTRAQLVSSGVLPVRATTPDGVFTDLRAGQVGELTASASKYGDGGNVPIEVNPHMPWTWWTLCLVLCAIPLLVSFFVRPRAVR
ncbi:hypothetical protein GCM10022243_57790 [Saccharothrix violaceirubra]|uniref:Signal peptidase I n=1 Tax=Saccharothrix violaceirubra TaxID=413306 RepID=A0A7W7T3B1_9PSEU|nr:signal peptidase I [Saccharothrix violaceirubra]MBB4965789.1 signal peptidase I [Saccharothrix violaceirubra]